MRDKGEDDKGQTAKNKELELFVRAKETHRIALMIKANVIAMSIGQRTRKGQAVEELVVKVYVSKKLPKDLIAKEDLIPSTLDIDNKKVAVDVEESDIPVGQSFNLRSRPLIGGSSIGPATNNWTGTLGVCMTLDDGQTYVLSNNHVLAMLNTLPIGTYIVQPSIPDGGVAPSPSPSGSGFTTNDLVAFLSKFVPIRSGSFSVSTGRGRVKAVPFSNFVDCALARVIDQYNGANREIHWVGYPSAITIDRVSLDGRFLVSSEGGGGGPSVRVCKMGRTTGFTTGTISALYWDGYISYPPINTGLFWFENQIKIKGDKGRPFSDSGDSGSLVLDALSLQPIGLHFAGLPGFSLCNHIGDEMSALGISHI